MKLTEAVAKRLKMILKEKDMTQYELFKISGVPQSTISTILKCEIQTIKLSTLYDICSGLGMEFEEFFSADFLKLEKLDD